MTLIAAGRADVALAQTTHVAAWGNNSEGQTSVPDALSGVVQVACGSAHTVALKDDGTVVAWGYNHAGQTIVPDALSGVVQVAAGVEHTVALKDDGTVVAWGYTTHGGRGQVNVPDALSGVIQVAAGAFHTVALKDDGTVVAWGYNNHGQVSVPDALSGVVQVAAGAFHTVALKDDGTAVAWGYNNYGQVSVPDALSGVVQVAAGAFHTVALKDDGTVVAWGNNSEGQTSVPDALSGGVQVAAGTRHTVALKDDGTVVAWGYNHAGQTSVPDALSGVVQVAAGAFHTVALWKHENAAPTADAGDAQTIIAGQTVQLDGSASSDPDDDPLTYDWSLNAPAGSTASLDDDSAIAPSFCADEAGDYTASLTVNDGFTDSQPDEATITALSTDEALDALDADLKAFGPDGDGTLNMGQVDALTRKLEQAQKLLDKAKTDEALLVLADYQMQLNDLEDEGVLNPAQRQALEEPASAITAVLEAPCTGAAAKYASASETATLSSLSETPTDYALGNYPNPFNPETSITFALPEAGTVRVAVYDMLGREVARLVEGSLEAGRHEVRFDARTLPSGTYVYRMEAGSFSQTRTMLLVK